MNKLIYAIVINYKDYSQLKNTLKKLSKINKIKNYIFKTIVVDQSFDEVYSSKLEKTFQNMIFIKTMNNLGVAGAFNKGMKYALTLNAEFFLLLNADITVKRQDIENLLDALIGEKQLGAVCPRVFFDTNPLEILFEGGSLDKKIHSSIHERIKQESNNKVLISEILNCPVLIKKDVIKKVGYWNESYFLYYEDTDWYLKVRKHGFKLGVVLNALAFTNKTSENEQYVLRKEYYLSRNLLYFNKYNYSLMKRIIAYIYIARDTIIFFKKTKIKNRLLIKIFYYKLMGIFDFLTKKNGYKEFNI